MKHRYQRGQTLPFWAIGILAFLALLFFTINYANLVRWDIRGQNAADGAASAGIATDANMHNELNTILYAATIDENRMRYLLQGAINTVNDPSGCLSPANCATIYNQDVAAFNVAAQAYSSLRGQWQQADNLSKGGLQNSPTSAIALIGTNCSILDCAFTYTTSIDSTNEIVDVVACKNVSIVAPSIMGLSNLAAFSAVGRSASTLIGIPEAFAPGVTMNPKTGAVYQVDESPAGASGAEFGVTYKTLTVNLEWFTAGATHPAAFSGSYGCS
ncbi:MAG TPA: pilus assembly protein TadG-related protein [Candidatus Baltobacteraceae bacterium]|nr:pilus assembly protein TadG-related protein [Candidatus Baltobacteraceae bacterium]